MNMVERAELHRLAGKYRQLAALWRANLLDNSPAARAAFRPIADEFPGALRELQRVPLEELERRAEALERAAEAGRAEPWMEWMHSYHQLMRAALHIKRQLGGRAAVSDIEATALADQAGARAGVTVDIEFVRAVAAPPDGRLGVVVFERLGVLFGRGRDEIWDALFPPVRPGRY